MYIKVENGSTVGRKINLPKVYKFADGSTNGNFNLLDVSTHIAEGFYPIEEVTPVYDRRIERLAGYTDDVQADKVVRTFVKESIPLEVLKQEKIAAIERHEQGLVTSSMFLYDEKPWNLTPESSQNVDGLQTAMSLPNASFPSPFSWTDADGNEVPMNEAYFQGFAGAMLNAKLTIAGVSKYHKAAVSALTEPLDVAEYDFSAGWGNYEAPTPEGDII